MMCGTRLSDSLVCCRPFAQPKGFKFDSYPDEFIAWLVFRRLVDVVLAADVVCYFALCFRFFEVPADGITFTVVLQYFVGLLLSAFALWSKSDAYRVIGSFAWYWGDFFFLVPQELQFDRVFGIAPHPMYTLGYSFFYGMSLICHSYVVFLVSLVAHGCQMLFLLLVENPHIEKTCQLFVLSLTNLCVWMFIQMFRATHLYAIQFFTIVR